MSLTVKLLAPDPECREASEIAIILAALCGGGWIEAGAAYGFRLGVFALYYALGADLIRNMDAFAWYMRQAAAAGRHVRRRIPRKLNLQSQVFIPQQALRPPSLSSALQYPAHQREPLQWQRRCDRCCC